jgi:hypothetical protein
MILIHRNRSLINNLTGLTLSPNLVETTEVEKSVEQKAYFLRFAHYSSPRWSSGPSSWLQIQKSRVRFPALPEFLRSSGSGTGSTQPREYN